MRARVLTVAAVVVAAVSLAAVTWVMTRPDFTVPAGVTGGSPQWSALIAPIAWTVTGAVLLWLRPHNAMPGLDGATAARQILDRFPGIGVLVLTMHEDDEALFGALRAGARGYLLKGADREEIVRAVLAVAAGDAVYSANVARRIVGFFTSAHQTYTAQVFPELTGREREILDLVAAGLGNHEIARRLVLSEKTVRNNVAAILTKLQVPDRAAAVAKARDTGLGAQPR
jgi:DNA-binding NarL/FixJ family response regulator